MLVQTKNTMMPASASRTEVPVAPRGRERLKEREKEPEVLTSDLSVHSCVSGMQWNDQLKSRDV